MLRRYDLTSDAGHSPHHPVDMSIQKPFHWLLISWKTDDEVEVDSPEPDWNPCDDGICDESCDMHEKRLETDRAGIENDCDPWEKNERQISLKKYKNNELESRLLIKIVGQLNGRRRYELDAEKYNKTEKLHVTATRDQVDTSV
ncbi:Hypothetical predicted protein [Octopus vulgaris]|uniref:Uncharacterized protein n=1 Tax=Octopus vulgaris TaxID=6645 RepID=A0AA36EYK9_OCTVU|nr:Hypothetical predicted protein [Octopus vulgaris]